MCMQKEFEIKNNVLIMYNEQKEKNEVVIPDGIVEIGSCAFYKCGKIKKILLMVVYIQVDILDMNLKL